MAVDCRSLIEFCKAFEQHRNMGNSSPQSDKRSSQGRRRSKSLNPLSHPFCEHSPFAAIDIIVLLLALGALGALAIPSFKFIFLELLPVTVGLVCEAIYDAPVACAAGFVMVVAAIPAWMIIHHRSRRCGKRYCKGLRKAVEFDIQLESEECVRYLPPTSEEASGIRPLELGQDHKELEAELKRMAPLNGRTVLIFRKPCGCPIGRMEVWGAKKVCRIKK